MVNLLKKISITVNDGNAKEVETYFDPLQYDNNDKLITSFFHGDEDKLGSGFRELQNNLASSDSDHSVVDADAVGGYQSLSAVDSYENKLGRSFRNLHRSLMKRNNAKGKSGDADTETTDTEDYPFFSAVGSYEEGLGKKIKDLQKRISKGTTNKGKNSGAGMVAATAGAGAVKSIPKGKANGGTGAEAPPSPTSVDVSIDPSQNHLTNHDMSGSISNPPTNNDHIHKKGKNVNRKRHKSGLNRDLKVAALNYFCDSRGRDMKAVCRDNNMRHIYPTLKAIVRQDEVLKRINDTMRPGSVHHRPEAIERINQLITHKLDFYNITATTSNKVSNPTTAGVASSKSRGRKCRKNKREQELKDV